MEENSSAEGSFTSNTSSSPSLMDMHKQSKIMLNNFLKQITSLGSSSPQSKNTTTAKSTKKNLSDGNVSNSTPIFKTRTTRNYLQRSLSYTNGADLDVNQQKSSKVSKPVNSKTGKKCFT